MKKELIDKFHSSVDSSGGNDYCWPWTKSLMSKGYGNAWNGETVVRAHRMAYSLAHGVTLSREQQVLHRCDNRKCCNPSHLFLGDNEANMLDKIAKGRQSKGESTGRTTLTAEQVRDIRENYSQAVRRATAELFGVTPQAISHILCGSRWKHI